MAQTTSALWKILFRMPNTVREYQFDINGTIYGPEAEVEHNVTSESHTEDQPTGNASCASLTISLYADSIPRSATIKRYIRLRNGEQVSEWLPYGVFFTNRRAEEDGYWTVEAFDGMRKGDVVWVPNQSLEFPMTMPDAVDVFCEIMGVELDSRTVLNSNYTIDYPANDYTIRNELCYIAAAHGGNWIMTGSGKLLLVPYGGLPDETHYLVEEYGDAITFGGDRILV